MKIKEIRELTTEELLNKIEELKEELFNLRFANATGNLEKPSRIKEIRKTIARIKMVIRERDENKRKEIVGIVISDKNDKTITVKVETYRKHPLYNKRVKSSKKYTAHDELNKAKVGDKVRIVETRPLSKTKRYELVEIVEEAIIL